MSQSHRQSLIEAATNIWVGYLLAVIGNIIILPRYGAKVTLTANFSIGIWFSLLSFCRSYLLRRFFNWSNHRHGAGK